MNAHSGSKRLYIPLILSVFVLVGTLRGAAPPQLSDTEFWKLATESSEEDGTFRSDNLLSNETTFQYVIPEFLKVAKEGRVYMGVGPEQNFTYISALKPSMAFIIDIRHGNFDVHLLYKALFELSTDRADFVFRLFSRQRPANITAGSSINEIFNALEQATGSKELYEKNLKAVEEQLTQKHKFPLTTGDHEGIEWALGNYYQFGAKINYGSSLSGGRAPDIVGASNAGGRGGGSGATYDTLMLANDGLGLNRSYLATEENFKVVKDLETRNLIVPVVGDFGGTKAIRAVGQYLKGVDARVSAFYVSNVEQFLTQGGGGAWENFCGSVKSLPIDDTSVFIRSGRGGPYTKNSTGGNVQNSSTAPMLPELMCAETAR